MTQFWLPKPCDLSSTVAIMGCGWLGLPLAISLIEEGYKVHGSTTSQEKIERLKKERILPALISLTEEKIQGNMQNFLQDVDTMIINVPPKLRGGKKENYVKKIQLLHQEIKKSSVQNILFVSSTSVYGDLDGEVTESTSPKPVTESGKQLLEAEEFFKKDASLKTTILRFGGLIGPDRHPIFMLAGRKNLSNGGVPINLIHLNDCIRIIKAILGNSWWNEVINGVYPSHPAKRDYYAAEAQKRGLQMPDYKEYNPKKGKIICAEALINVKKFKFTTTL